MTRLGGFSIESLAVDSVSADIDLLEKLAARGGTLCEYDMKLLARCNARLSQLIPVLAASKATAASGSSPAAKPPAKLKRAGCH